MTGKEHAKLLGLFLWLLTGFQIVLFGGICLLYLFIFGAVFSSIPRKAGDPPPEIFMGFIVVIIAIIMVSIVLFSIPKIIAGYGLRKGKSWAKVWAIIACIMACMWFPFGTAVGVYGLVFLFGENGKAYFDDPNYGRFAPDSGVAPPPNSWQT